MSNNKITCIHRNREDLTLEVSDRSTKKGSPCQIWPQDLKAIDIQFTVREKGVRKIAANLSIGDRRFSEADVERGLRVLMQRQWERAFAAGVEHAEKLSAEHAAKALTAIARQIGRRGPTPPAAPMRMPLKKAA